MRKIPLNFSLFDSAYGSTFPDEQYFIILFDSLPSKHSSRNIYSNDIKEYLIKLGFVEESRVKNGRHHREKSLQSLYVDKNRQMMINMESDMIKDPDLVMFEFLYNIQNGDLSSQLNFDEIKTFQKVPRKSNIQLVRSNMGQLDTEEYDLTIPLCDLELNYGKEFLKLHETIVHRLNAPGDKGIILFHGDPGTGKTTYIKILTSLVTNKDILFIPPSMAEMLSEPSIIPFLMDHKNSILLIEDAEKVISDREGRGSQAGVSNILNLTDGILGDCLNIQVIATFNMPKERIDKALLRKGRLICEHKFEKLNITDTNILLKYLDKGIESKIPLTLADIYNIEVDVNRVPDQGFVGFKTVR